MSSSKFLITAAVACWLSVTPSSVRTQAADTVEEPTSNQQPPPLTLPLTEDETAAAQAAWAKSLNRDVIEKNSIGMELVLIPPGSFLMGSSPKQRGHEGDESPVDVTLTNPFAIGRTEVTQTQWQAVMGSTPWHGKNYIREGDSYPATHVSWEDAQAYCRKLSELEGAHYRLPTEAEWEFACRAGTTTALYWGDKEEAVADYAWYGGIEFIGNARDEQYPHEVALKKPNAFGLYDMSGNVWEWCEDVYDTSLPGGTDPVRTGDSSVRTMRGNGWTRHVGHCRSANREWVAQSPRNNDIGFRVVRRLPN